MDLDSPEIEAKPMSSNSDKANSTQVMKLETVDENLKNLEPTLDTSADILEMALDTPPAPPAPFVEEDVITIGSEIVEEVKEAKIKEIEEKKDVKDKAVEKLKEDVDSRNDAKEELKEVEDTKKKFQKLEEEVGEDAKPEVKVMIDKKAEEEKTLKKKIKDLEKEVEKDKKALMKADQAVKDTTKKAIEDVKKLEKEIKAKEMEEALFLASHVETKATVKYDNFCIGSVEAEGGRVIAACRLTKEGKCPATFSATDCIRLTQVEAKVQTRSVQKMW